MNDMPVKVHLASLHELSSAKIAEATNAIHEALAILEAIELGGLLDALPETREDRHRHQTGRTLLSLLEQRLRRALATSSGQQ